MTDVRGETKVQARGSDGGGIGEMQERQLMLMVYVEWGTLSVGK